ncbi:MAG: hypothetical protein ACOYKZ_08175, partial [Chlamydiia bacterium]
RIGLLLLRKTCVRSVGLTGRLIDAPLDIWLLFQEGPFFLPSLESPATGHSTARSTSYIGDFLPGPQKAFL